MCKGGYAEAMAKNLLKGRRITVEGKLKQQNWTDTNGGKHSKVIIRVANISLAPFGNNSFRPTEETQRVAENYQQQQENYDPAMFDDQEEIPF
jgi:single-stranded DNA-binding protein